MLEYETYGFSIRTCVDFSELNDDFEIQENLCYDFLDRHIWNSITTEPYPQDRNLIRMEGSFCWGDMCNVDDVTCADRSEKGKFMK